MFGIQLKEVEVTVRNVERFQDLTGQRTKKMITKKLKKIPINIFLPVK
jgi:hypothetical protein